MTFAVTCLTLTLGEVVVGVLGAILSLQVFFLDQDVDAFLKGEKDGLMNAGSHGCQIKGDA